MDRRHCDLASFSLCNPSGALRAKPRSVVRPVDLALADPSVCSPVDWRWWNAGRRPYFRSRPCCRNWTECRRYSWTGVRRLGHRPNRHRRLRRSERTPQTDRNRRRTGRTSVSDRWRWTCRRSQVRRCWSCQSSDRSPVGRHLRPVCRTSFFFLGL